MATMQYARLPQFQYQKFDGNHRYQSYNPQTLGFTYHPISPKPATPAPEKEVTDTEPEKENTEQVVAEENPPAPAEESPAPPQDEGNVIMSINKCTPAN